MRVGPWLFAVSVLMLASLTYGQSGPIRPTDAAGRDVEHTMQARKLLHNEPDLATLNIGVSVQNRVATLFGPVPSVDAIFRAELCLRSMIGLVEIRNEMFVSDQVEPIRPPVKLHSPSINPPDVTPPLLPHKAPMNFKKPEEPTRQAPKANKQPVAQKTSQPKASLGHPEAESDLASVLRALLGSKSIYEKVQFTIDKGCVYLSAPEENADALHEASRAIARLPGVASVVLMDRTLPR